MGSEMCIRDRVYYEGVDKPGVILSINENIGKAKIQINNIKIDADIHRIIPVSENKKKIEKDKIPVIKVNDKLDLRGMSAQDAIQLLDEYLDEAYAGGLNEVTIIHGKGKGILRKEVWKFIEKDKRVKSQRIGAWNEGDIGVTIIQLKV